MNETFGGEGEGWIELSKVVSCFGPKHSPPSIRNESWVTDPLRPKKEKNKDEQKRGDPYEVDHRTPSLVD